MDKLIRRKRIFSRTTIHTAPEVFLFLPLVSRSESPVSLNKHLVWSIKTAQVPGLPLQVDHIFISHYHHPDDDFLNLEEIDAEAHSNDQSSISSVVRKTFPLHDAGNGVHRRFEAEVRPLTLAGGMMVIPSQEIDRIRQLGQCMTICAKVRRYLQDIVVFLRLERGVAGGVSPYATSQFELLTKYSQFPDCWR